MVYPRRFHLPSSRGTPSQTVPDIDVARTTDTTLDVMSEKHIEDYWNVDGDGELSDALKGFTRFIVLTERPLDGFTWSGRRLTKKQTTSRPDNVWPDLWKHMSDASKRKEKQKWAIEKPKLDNARRLRGIFFIEPAAEEFQRIMKNARRKWEIPMLEATPCRIQLNQHGQHGETCGHVGQHKTKYACIVEAKESMRTRMEGSQSKNTMKTTS